MSKNIYLDAPNIGEEEKLYLNKAVDSGFVSTAGPFVPDFEKRVAGYLDTKQAVSTQSGTAALHMALFELGIGKNDEVILPALTFVATATPIMYVGAKPVFVDISRETWNIDPKEIEKAITSNTKAIIVVHLYGNPCNMDEIADISARKGLCLIEDAAESLGATYKGKKTGTFGDLNCLSFNGNKLITTGGGGMVVGNDNEKLEHIRYLVNQARDGLDDYCHSEIGFNYRMTNIAAAVGLAQMEKLDDFLARKKLFNQIYRKELHKTKIRFQEEYEGAESSCWLSCVTFEEDVDLAALQEQLKEKGIPARRIFMPIVEFPPFKMYKKGSYANSYHIYERGLCLPGSTLNSESEIYYICDVLRRLLD